MKTIQQTLLLVILLFSGIAMQAQNEWSINGNTAIDPATEMLGTTDNQPIPFRTNNAERMRLYQSQTSTVNGFTVDQTGYLLLSREPVLFNTLGPFSMLHLGGVQGSSKC